MGATDGDVVEEEAVAVFVMVVHGLRYGMDGIMRKLACSLFDLAHIAC
jgi:hypothetical protein